MGPKLRSLHSDIGKTKVLSWYIYHESWAFNTVQTQGKQQTNQARGHLLQRRLQPPSCKLKSIPNAEREERVETGKGGGKGLGKNGPFVSPNGSFGGVTGVL